MIAPLVPQVESGTLCTVHANQTLNWDGRILQVTIAALPSFVSDRQTALPEFVLAFAVVTVFIIAVLIGELPIPPAMHFRYSLLLPTYHVRIPRLMPTVRIMWYAGVVGFGMMFRLEATRRQERSVHEHKAQVGCTPNLRAVAAWSLILAAPTSNCPRPLRCCVRCVRCWMQRSKHTRKPSPTPAITSGSVLLSATALCT